MFSKLKTIIYFFTFFLGFTLASSVSAAITIRPALNLGLTGYWAMDEGYGNKAYDQSGNGNTGTLTQMNLSSVWQDGKLGRALNFDGINDRVIIPTQTMGTFTISAWINKPTTADYAGVFTGNTTNEGIYITGENQASVDRYKINFYYGPDNHLNNTQMSNNVWHHIAVTVNAGSVTFYLDGSPDGTATGAPTFAYSDIGYNSYSANYPFSGKIDEFRLYNRALSAGEIQRLYNLTKPKIKAASDLGLVGYWSFEEGIGTKAGDMSGNGNNGTLTLMDPATDWVNGKRGKALDFDGVNDYVNLGTFSVVSDQMTMAAWVYVTAFSSPDVQERIINKADGTGTENHDWMLSFIDNSGRKLRLRFNRSINTLIGNTNLSAGRWYYVAATYNNGTGIIYLDGVADGSGSFGTGTLPNNTNPVYIGAKSSLVEFLNGKIDEVRIYNRALSASEVANLYNASKKIMKVNTSQNLKLTTGLVGLWSFNGPDVYGTTAFDRSGQGNNGTISGATLDSGKVGQALNFDGNNDYINAGSPASLDDIENQGGGGLTISAWIYPETWGESGVGAVITKGSHDDAAGSWTFRLGQANTNIEFFKDYNGTNFGIRADANLISTQAWFHVAVTWDGTATSSNNHIYINNVNVPVWGTDGTGTKQSDINENVYVGSDKWTSNVFDGNIDEVRIYNRVLSAAEITRLYQMGK